MEHSVLESVRMPRLEAIVDRAFKWLSDRAWLSLLVARLAMASEFIPSGLSKLGRLPEFTAYFASLGIPAPGLSAPVTAAVEFVCGILLLIGLGTRFAAAALAIDMTVAILTARIHDAPTIDDFFYLPETAYIVIFLVLIFSGPGLISVDQIIAARRASSGRPPFADRAEAAARAQDGRPGRSHGAPSW
jgi:putative oxidoreductase